MLGSREDKRSFHIVFFKKAFQKGGPVFFTDVKKRMRNSGAGNEASILTVTGRFKISWASLLICLGHGSRENQGLPFGGQSFHNAPDIREKSLLKHVIGFVQDKELKMIGPDSEDCQKS